MQTTPTLTCWSWLYDAVFCCWHTSTFSCIICRAGPTAWKPRSALSEGFFLALWPGSITIRSAGGIFGFPWLVYSLRYSRGGQWGCRLPSPTGHETTTQRVPGCCRAPVCWRCLRRASAAGSWWSLCAGCDLVSSPRPGPEHMARPAAHCTQTPSVNPSASQSPSVPTLHPRLSVSNITALVYHTRLITSLYYYIFTVCMLHLHTCCYLVPQKIQKGKKQLNIFY